MKVKLKSSRYSLKYRARLQDCKDIGKRAFFMKKDGKRAPFPRPLISN